MNTNKEISQKEYDKQNASVDRLGLWFKELRKLKELADKHGYKLVPKKRQNHEH